MQIFFEKLNTIVPNVSRETFDQLCLYTEHLVKWNNTINLVRFKSINDLWERHLLDCAALVSLLPKDAKILIDLGSGGGFPGIILCILRPLHVHLIESDTRKSIFLTEVGRTLHLPLTVHNDRIEKLPAFESDVITSRALASCPNLLQLASPFIEKTKICLFQTGENSVKEVVESDRVHIKKKIVIVQGGRFNEQCYCSD